MCCATRSRTRRLLAWSASTTSTATAKPVVRIAVRFMPSPSPHGRGAAAAQILMAGDLADLGQHLPAAFAFVAFGQLRYHRNTAGILAAESLRRPLALTQRDRKSTSLNS